MIDDNSWSVIVPYDAVAEEMIRTHPLRRLSVSLRRLQQYTVNLWENDFEKGR